MASTSQAIDTCKRDAAAFVFNLFLGEFVKMPAKLKVSSKVQKEVTKVVTQLEDILRQIFDLRCELLLVSSTNVAQVQTCSATMDGILQKIAGAIKCDTLGTCNAADYSLRLLAVTKLLPDLRSGVTTATKLLRSI